MIIVKLIGGLGNQMFQYAAARRLAEHHSTILKLDVTGFETYKLHRYSLHCFQIWDYVATQQEINALKDKFPYRVARLVLRMGTRLSLTQASNILKRSGTVFRESHFHFDPSLLNAPNNVYLEGYWQSERYFVDIKDILCREFTIKYPQDLRSQEITKIILDTESVALHIRRTDYVASPISNQVYGVCDLDYYHRAIAHLTQRISQPHFFIFSDDPHWARENLNLDLPMTIVDHNDASRNYEDLRLMSQCKHNIIANSTFSWWGAWLNRNPRKTVIAPKKWLNDNRVNTDDVIPGGWIKL